jgi:hypothetical protein
MPTTARSSTIGGHFRLKSLSKLVSHSTGLSCRAFKKELYNAIPNVTNSLYVFKCKRFRNSNIWSTIVKPFLKHLALPVKFTLDRNYPR